MSPYTSTGGGRAPNVSRYLRDLNTVKEPGSAEENFTFEDDLAMFTNTQFFDFETGQHTDYQAPPKKAETATVAEPQAPSSAVTEELTSPIGDFGNVDFSLPGEFNFHDFTNPYPASGVPPFAEGLGNLQPLQPNPQPTYAPPPVSQQHNHHYAAPTPSAAETRTPESLNGVSRPGHSFEEQSRVAAEEDKRRRNTAASARFRIKKKQREQALEKSAKEMSDKVSALEQRINLLETENRWLKNLVMEKNEGSEDIASMLKEFQNKQTKTTATSSDSLKAEEAK
ncbi:basic region leucine zipper [Colletotrichum paranaense]|uniref:Regulatory protein cys-3 n=6 Tax=Colletotrichum acutatum species complex TaxID=2707335 RepID=A0A9P7RBD3_9PEZI|nr:basic region leucine zipper [Colletotrichum scovillei]XP_060317262.1 basic region leucine zipper [Colletotrichum costaricense]XP_060351898.1 basic region leucine zipper [Colletotrichum paranaense]XP_060387172.1 basic region leucine zipper [Colletotrichum tamarilloi]KAK1459222.1 basic region leucine zipper [Colletotrichum melonis]KXH34845.1 basic region leucine zipper [Colletotrichum simmondsii]KAF4776642.1 basic region leucine zipper [Colletotrichum scovillei]KAG7054258.1 regulatory prote